MAASVWLLVVALSTLGPEPTPVGPEPVDEEPTLEAAPDTEGVSEPGPEDGGGEDSGPPEAEAEGAPGAAVEPAPEPVPEPQAEPVPEPQAEPEPEPKPAIEFAEPESDPFIEQPSSPSSVDAPARPPKQRGPQPPVYGPLLLTGGIGVGARSVGLGVGATGFPIPYIGIGLDLDDTIFFGDGVFNEFAATPHVWVLATPYRSVTPFVRGGFGVDVFSSGLGVYGIWKAAGGVIFRFGKAQRVAIRGGVEVIGRVSDSKFSDNFVCGLVDNPCSLRLRPELGFGLRFGGPR